jgi:hypothetical protein
MTPTTPALWINLDRAEQRRRRMTWALEQGGWNHQRFPAIDAAEHDHRFRTRPVLGRGGSRFPGVRRFDEDRPFRRTTRPELACLASWQAAIVRARSLMDESGTDHVLIMEDDIGSSLSVPEAWPVSLEAIVRDADGRAGADGSEWTAIQLAPISSRARKTLFDQWVTSERTCLTVPKTTVRSHGNGAVLLHRRALSHFESFGLDSVGVAQGPHHLRHPWAVRPVADKWLYACLPEASVLVLSVPLFCLDATDSEVHRGHVERFHRSSREVTCALWEEAGLTGLLEALSEWDRVG